jgi:Cupin domain
MRRLVLAALVCAAAMAHAEQKKMPVPVPPPLPPSTEDLLFAELAGAKWTPSEKAGLPKGAEIALIGADPVSLGVTAYLKAPAGWKLPLHWHTHTEYNTLLFGRGTLIVDGKKHVLTAGAYTILPGKVQHEFTCEVDPNAGVGGLPGCIFLVRRSGPTDFHWVNAAK